MLKICLDAGHQSQGSDTGAQGSSKTPIMGSEEVTVVQCRQFIRKVNPNAPDIIPFYQKYGEILGIRWGCAVAQMIKETNYLRFTGDVKPEQNNFAGIGALGGGVVGAAFATPEQGVIAHLEHLYAYASTSALPVSLPKVDPRFGLVTRGIAPNWEDLNGRWAVPGNSYGQEIVAVYNQMLKEFGQGDVYMKYLILYYGDADLQIAANLALFYQCPIVQAAFATSELLAGAETKYQVGGSTAPVGVTLLGGSDRFDTMKSVLKAMGKV
jgi:Mannosyl-glycoprotein endo-beta-N-acetylglucosaminidase.